MMLNKGNNLYKLVGFISLLNFGCNVNVSTSDNINIEKNLPPQIVKHETITLNDVSYDYNDLIYKDSIYDKGYWNFGGDTVKFIPYRGENYSCKLLSEVFFINSSNKTPKWTYRKPCPKSFINSYFNVALINLKRDTMFGTSTFKLFQRNITKLDMFGERSLDSYDQEFLYGIKKDSIFIISVKTTPQLR